MKSSKKNLKVEELEDEEVDDLSNNYKGALPSSPNISIEKKSWNKLI